MQKSKILLFSVLATVVVLGIAFGALVTTRLVSHSGTIVGTGDFQVYDDNSCITPLTSITWANVNTVHSYTKTAYIKNTGSELLWLSWSSTSSNGLVIVTMTWNGAYWDHGSFNALNIGEVMPIEFEIGVQAGAALGAFTISQTFSASDTSSG